MLGVFFGVFFGVLTGVLTGVSSSLLRKIVIFKFLNPAPAVCHFGNQKKNIMRRANENNIFFGEVAEKY